MEFNRPTGYQQYLQTIEITPSLSEETQLDHNEYERHCAQWREYLDTLVEQHRHSTAGLFYSALGAELPTKEECASGTGDGGINVVIPSYGDPRRLHLIPHVLDQFTTQGIAYAGKIRIIIGDNGMSENARRAWQTAADERSLEIHFADADPWIDDDGNPMDRTGPKNKNRANAGTARNEAIRYMAGMSTEYPSDNTWQRRILFVDDDSKVQDSAIGHLMAVMNTTGARAVTPERIQMVTQLDQHGHNQQTPDTPRALHLPHPFPDGSTTDAMGLIAYGSTAGIKTAAVMMDAESLYRLNTATDGNVFISQPNGSAEDIAMMLFLADAAKAKGIEAYDLVRTDPDGTVDRNAVLEQKRKWGADHGHITDILDKLGLTNVRGVTVREPVDRVDGSGADWIEYQIPPEEINLPPKYRALMMNIPQLIEETTGLRERLVSGYVSHSEGVTIESIDKLLTVLQNIEDWKTRHPGRLLQNSPVLPVQRDRQDLRLDHHAIQSLLIGLMDMNADPSHKLKVYVLRHTVRLREESDGYDNHEGHVVQHPERGRAAVIRLTDYDGTICNQLLPESQRFASSVQAERANKWIEHYNIPNGLATSRSTGEAIEIAQQLGIEGIHIAEDGGTIILPHIVEFDNTTREQMQKDGIEIYTFDNRTALKLTDFDFSTFVNGLESIPEIGEIISTAGVYSDSGAVDHEKVLRIQQAMGHPDYNTALRSAQRINSGCIVPQSDKQRQQIIQFAEQQGVRAFGEVLNIMKDVNKGRAIHTINKYASQLLENRHINGIVPIFNGNSGENDVEACVVAQELGGIGVIVAHPEAQNGKTWFDEDQEDRLRQSRTIRTTQPYGYGLIESVPDVLDFLNRTYDTKLH